MRCSPPVCVALILVASFSAPSWATDYAPKSKESTAEQKANLRGPKQGEAEKEGRQMEAKSDGNRDGGNGGDVLTDATVTPAPESATPTDDSVKKSKVVLLVLVVFDLMICGIHRCYLGSCCIGILQLITCGGCGIWALIDWVLLVQNALDEKTEINKLGMEAKFDEDDIDAAKILAYVAIVLMTLYMILHVFSLFFKVVTAKKEGEGNQQGGENQALAGGATTE